jgi:hypothetical protein
MSNPNEAAQEPIEPVATHDADEIKEKELEGISGGRRMELNPQPLPPLV